MHVSASLTNFTALYAEKMSLRLIVATARRSAAVSNCAQSLAIHLSAIKFGLLAEET